MPRKNSYITIKDQFCGAGGSSQGANRALQKFGGGEVKVGLNHWKLAIETYSTNNPNTLVDCTDVSACDPRKYPSTDILITSPECTTHSPAGGNNHKTLKKQMDLFDTGKIDPSTERSRATMWDVCRFTEYHRYNLIIVENVVEAKTRWALFDVWLTAMHTLGYNHRCCYHNSMHHHPTPQSRDRMYVVFWKKGNKAPNLDYTPLAYCVKCGGNVQSVQTWKRLDKQYGKYKQQYVYCCPSCTSIVEPYYYASFNCIDWSDIGKRIGDRKKPLKPKTISRIEFGKKKFSNNPFLVQIAYGGTERGIVRSVADPHYSQATTSGQAIVQPFIVNDLHSSGIDFRVKGVAEQLPTIQTTHQLKLITPFIVKLEHSQREDNVKDITDPLSTQTIRQSMMLINPFIIKGEHSGIDPLVRQINDSLQTQVTRQTMALVTPPFVVIAKGQSKAKLVTDSLSTQTGMINHGIVSNDSWNSFIAAYYNGSHCVKHFTEELGTVSTHDRSSIITYKEPELEDCFYRMLKPKEIKLAMAFDENYKVLGNSRDQVKQLGNAVTPPAMEWLVERCIESLN